MAIVFTHALYNIMSIYIQTIHYSVIYGWINRLFWMDIAILDIRLILLVFTSSIPNTPQAHPIPSNIPIQ